MTTGKFLAASLLGTAVLVSSALAQPASDGGRKFTTELTGEAEVDSTGAPNQGDLDGTGTASVTVNPGQQRICFEITVDGIAAPTRGHIHRAPAGSNGAVVVGFFEAEAVDLDGCVATTRALAIEIIQHPERFYVNVHNGEFPAGALRGQLSKK